MAGEAGGKRGRAAGGVHGFTARRLGGGTREAPAPGAEVALGDLCAGKVALIENVATM